ncbi:type I restriction-modification system subunit M [Methanohalophilus mahii]|uniref:site-specific DNA-methyltransferase (adenine-specific) n=1 Tax=Methanohalophilus mahii (strain ATCC 35705 / DSM 5219 / SLP) TaxID=547558 RepID=D5EBK7_METMS|nr:class I SAM-dependent DNA methyltransferase [Methanohalophilus mahii]ADE36558.1 N-6 DNA methylase [Methanohalophilus mahii DSM 5219]
MSEPISQQQLEQYLWGAATLLRGVIDPGEYKSIIFPLMFFKRISDVYDEEYQQALEESGGDQEYAEFAENHRFQVPAGAHWNDVRNVSINVGQAIKTAMDDIEKANPDKLTGIFGDANWTNKNRLSDNILIDLIEHFSTVNLSITNVPQDEFGSGYEYLIKKFADDSGHTAAEFYTNRTVVRLMSLIVDPKSGESIYDPTCGSGGMLLNAALLAKEKGQEYRNIKLYGQEINIITSAIARMNMFLHGFEDFYVIRGDTLSNPAFVEDDRVKKFDIVIANPPYSIKKWNRDGWIHDSWNRNTYGTPPQGCADYAFFQHIIASMKEDTGRCAILYPHGVLERNNEKKMRKEIIENDLIECVIGLGKNLFYNSSMKSCIVICNKNKPENRKNKILFIDAKDEISINTTQAKLESEHIDKIHAAYSDFKSIEKFANAVDIEEIRDKDYNLNIRMYVDNNPYIDRVLLDTPLEQYVDDWMKNSEKVKQSTDELKVALKEVIDNG